MKRINPNSEKNPIAIGYWRNDTNPLLPEPSKFVDHNIDSNIRNLVAKYLENGKRFIPMLGFSWCRFECGIEDHKMGSYCLTDGDYIWPQGLSHYIRMHDVWLPEVFINHVLKNIDRDLQMVDLNKLDLHDYSWWEKATLK
jgi:hypothetical protein